jgi:glycerophosphoryl diester phosphodiesterase
MNKAMLIVAIVAISIGVATRPGNSAEIIAHRGESFLAPENTLAAFNLAWKLGANVVELDVRLTADGHLIVCHDDDTKRTTGRKLLIHQSTLAELRQLDAGAWKGAQWAGQRLPTLAEVLDTVPDGRRLFVEVKVGPEAVPALKKAVETSSKRAEQVVVISFDRAVIAEVNRQMPKHQAMLILNVQPKKHKDRRPPTVAEVVAAACEVKADGVALSNDPSLDCPYVERLRRSGLKVNVWTVDSPEVARRLIELGVSSVTTNRAAWMKEQLRVPPSAPRNRR